VNLFSGFCAALACALGGRLLRGCGVRREGALAGAWLAGLADAVWGQSGIAEVYGTTLLAVFATLLLLHRWRESPTSGRFSAFLLVAGLSLCLQPLARGLLPLFLGYAILERPRLLREGRTLGWGALALLLGLLPILYLPLRSAAEPYLDWGNPETPRALWNHLAMRQYTHAEELGMDPPTFLGFGPRMEAFGGVLVRQFPWPVLALAGWGGIVATRRWGKFGVLLAATTVATSVLLVWFTSFRDAFFFPPAYETYCVPAFALLGLLAGAGIDALPLGRASRMMGPTVALAALAWTAAGNAPRNDRSDERFFEPFGRALLDNVERGGVLVAMGDHLVFPCLFLQRVRGYRTDVLVAQRYGYLEESDLGPLSQEERARRRGLRGAERWAFDEAMAVRRWLGSRPVYVAGMKTPEHYRGFRGLEGTLAVPEGILVRVHPPGGVTLGEARERSGSVWARLDLPPIDERSRDRSVLLAAALVRLTRGMHRAASGDLAGAREDLGALLRNPLADPVSLFNGARALAAAGARPEACELLRGALRISPRFEAARRLLVDLEGPGR
jgi:hypothetical protein